MEKLFTIRNDSENDQLLIISSSLGRILFRPEVDEIVKSFGSHVVNEGVNSIWIEPPVPPEKQAEFGDKLVELEQTLSPTSPPATYKIKP